MKLCTQCESGYPDGETVCPVHGKSLTEAGELPQGLLIGGAYRIVRKLGQGSKGTVYLVENAPEAGELKALKFLSPELSRDESFASRFERAAKRLSGLYHPNVLATGDLQRAEDDSLFLCMEYVDGPSLRVLLDIAPGPFDPSLALAITRCVAEGLGAAHAAGMIHLDLKPESILIARDGDSLAPKITNFGIGATREDGNTFLAAGRVLLTPKYAAPEQWLNTRPELLDESTDLYALGGILFEMLTRETVFDAVGYHAWSRQHLTAHPRKPSELRPELAEWHGLDDLVLALLAKEPGDRPKGTAALLVLLDAVQFGLRIPEIPPVTFVDEGEPIPIEPIQEFREQEAPKVAGSPAVAEAPAAYGAPSEVAAEVADETTSAFTGIPAEPIAEQEPASARETPVSFSDAPTGELAVVEPASEQVEPERAAEPAELTAPEPVEDLSVTSEPEHFYAHESFAAEPELRTAVEEFVPAKEDEPAPAEANAFVPLFTASEPESIPDTLPEPALGMPSAPAFAARTLVDEPVPATPPRFFASEFRPSEPEFIAGAAPEPERAITPSTQEAEDVQDSALDMDELNRLFGRPAPSVVTGIKSDAPPRRRTGAPNFFDSPDSDPKVERGSPASVEPTNFFGKPYTPSGIEEPPAPVADVPAFSSRADRFASAVEAPRPSYEEPSQSTAQASTANTVDWIDTGRAADPAVLRAALVTTAGATSVTGFDFGQPATEEVSEPGSHRGRTVWIVVAVVLLLAAAGFGYWRYTLYQADQPMAKLTAACNASDGKACYDLAALYEQDKTVSDGAARASALYSQSCDLKFPLACRKLGLKYLYGSGVALDTTKAIGLFGKGCDKNDFESCYHLADIYHEGTGVPMDDAKAVAVYSQACTAGDAFGCTWAKRLTPAPAVKHIPRRVEPDADSDSAQ